MSTVIPLSTQQRDSVLAEWVPLPRYLLRTRIVRNLIRRLAPHDFIEIGAASGEMAQWMSGRGISGTAVEISSEAIRMLRARLQGNERVQIFENDARDLKVETDLLLSMEVLEHIENDTAALANWFDLVRPGGHIVISVPAHQRRFSAEDEMAGHFRRYEKTELREKLMAAGFEAPRVMNYGFPLGLALKHLRTFVARARMKDDQRSQQERTEASGVERKQYRHWNWLLNDFVMTPFHWMQLPFLNFDLGDGLLAVAQKSTISMQIKN